MKEITMSNIIRLVKFDLKINKNNVIISSVIMFLVLFLYMILFPSIQEMAGIKFDALPEEFLQFIGTSSAVDFTNYNAYFGMIYPIMVVVMSILSIVFSTNIIRKEEKNKTIEFLYSLPVSKKEIFLSKFITVFIYQMAILLSASISTIICGFVVGGDTFNLFEIIQGIKISSLTVFIIGDIGLFLACISPKINTSITTGIALISYLFGFLGSILKDNGKILTYLSPYFSLNYSEVIVLSNNKIILLVVYLIFYIILFSISFKTYNKRDFQI